ncbi:hypothetical protein LIER_34021 [Lithospermum erythrorhizon]|uniref:BED-type domain-containing protein n=1 Tax=Lithospermum erythrorhizon TaxID=34254 RepID=A0AAV3RYA4_LITER
MEVVDESETPAKKPKRLTSIVWNHFERVRKADICYAVCVHCKKKLSGSSNSGTTHLRNHLIRCLKRSNYDVSQILTAKRKRKETTLAIANVPYEEGTRKDEVVSLVPYKFDQEQKKENPYQPINYGSGTFDQARSRMDLARMIMLHGYPLTMVEHLGFKLFVKNLQPLFEFLSSDVESDCMTIYMREKEKVYKHIHNLQGRINIAVDMWASLENARYMCLTAYYIDEDWKLQKQMLNFTTLDPLHTDDILSEVVIKCLTDWSIDRKLFSMTLDSCSAYDDMVFRMKDWLSQTKPLLKNGELFEARCAAQLLRSIVQDVMEDLQEVMHKIRESIRHVKSSQVTLGKFNEIAQQVGIGSDRCLLLDCSTQWNTTYSMLEAAIEYRGAFSILQEQDPSYSLCVSETEWEWASAVSGYMKLFVEVTNVFIGSECPTASIYFPEICDIYIQLIEWCESSDDFLSTVALKMKAKFDIYWSKNSLALAIAVVLDPRFKMKLVEYYYNQIYDGDASTRIKEVSDGIRELFSEYAMGLNSVDQDVSRIDSSLPSCSTGSSDRLKGFDRFVHETSQNQSMVSDIEKYLQEPVFPRICDFNILNWWKVHTPRYPILSMMARDVLAMPMSILGPDLVFHNGGRVLDRHRSSLNPETREALICGQDWLRTELGEMNHSLSNAARSLFLESS